MTINDIMMSKCTEQCMGDKTILHSYIWYSFTMWNYRAGEPSGQNTPIGI